MLEIGTIIDGKYKILNVIGQGGMSVVYLAMNEAANKPWAIKEVRKDSIKDFEIVKQGLIVETELLKKLSHSNLPSIVDVIEDREIFLIVMDYIEGKPLNWYLEEYGAQKQEDVISWALQLCDVLGYLHSCVPAIIYRDMKPANIMLTQDGSITLIDFGTAREFKEKNIADTTCLGTIGYAAPEQFGGQGQTDARTDIYGLGATLYHLVTGCNPCEPPYEIRPIREANPSLSGGLEKIIKKCTQRNPDDRYSSTAELTYDLEHFEKQDDEWRKKKKKQFNIFIISTVMTVLFLLIGISADMLKTRTATDDYNEAIEEAKKTTSQGTKIELYKMAIAVKPGEKEAYADMIEVFKEDSVFSTDEEGIVVSALKNHKGEISEDKQRYADICFETGKLYWYYYEYGSSADNRVNRMKSSINWFSDAVIFGGADFPDKNMALVYKEIGGFYRDIPSKAIEGADKGLYLPLFQKLNELMVLVEENSDESEIVKLELYELARYSIMQYATKFKTDGVTQDNLTEMLERVSEQVKAVQTTTEKTEQMQQETVYLLGDTMTAIATAYSTGVKEE